MEIEYNRIQELVQRPKESLSVEIKRWLDPASAEGKAKIVRACLALRNHGGGYLVIGFDDKTLLPDDNSDSLDIKKLFHVDSIQQMISAFTSEPFEVSVELPERDGIIHPVIVVPPGIKTPVASKSELIIDKKYLISINDVYVRSLITNNTPSTTKAGWRDWPKIVETCFENREADIGRFLRRHLGGLRPDMLRNIASALTQDEKSEPTEEDILRELLKKGYDRFLSVLQENGEILPDHGAWEVAMRVIGDVPPHSANEEFLNLIDSSNPDYTGWPVWLNSRGFSDSKARPYVFDGAWEAFIASLGSYFHDHIDFMRIEPKGRFYLRRAYQDDLSSSETAPAPLQELDFGLPILRIAEALAVGVAFAKAMGCDIEQTVLSFAFRWTRLRGRELSAWANPERMMLHGRRARQDEVLSFVSIPLNAPLSGLSVYVDHVVQPLFTVFDGFSLGKEVVEDLTRRLLERRL